GLRNLPFALFMGANDAAYGRNRIAAERAAELGRLAVADPGGYVHLARLYPGLGHWMNRQDAEAVPWMARFRRDPWPARVVWEQDDVVHRRFYWLRVPGGVEVRDRQRLVATLRDRTITLEGEVNFPVEVRLSDWLLDLDQQLVVKVGGREVFSGRVTRRARELAASLEERLDPVSAASAVVPVR
ncbi:MAG: polyhydroxyalkanoate depolymerase, partial [Verrucomicrobiota bacterium]